MGTTTSRKQKKKLKGEKEKSIFSQVISGKIIKKYQNMTKTSGVVSKYFLNKHLQNKSLVFNRNTTNQKNKLKKLEKSVQTFLERDENSMVAPGANDTIVKNKEKQRKRYLTDTISNLYEKYKTEGLMQMSCATLYRLKPFWIVSKPISARDTTMCKIHTNMRYLIEKCAFLKIINDETPKSFVNSRTCNPENKDCFYGDCSSCKYKQIPASKNVNETWYYKWITQNVERPGAKGRIYSVKVTSKEKINCTISQLVNEINDQMPYYFKHIYDTLHQNKAIASIKENRKENEVFIVMDFSQNYLFKYNEEIHSAHFGASKKQVTLHTGTFFYRNSKSNQVVYVSFCTVSECLRHDASAVWAHLQPILRLIKHTVYQK